MSAHARLIPLAGLAVGALALAACGSSTAKTASNPVVPSTAPATTAAPTAKAVVATTQNAKLGVILVDAEGRTLYTLTNAGKPVACTGTCAHVWPPLLLPNGATTPTGTNVTGLTTVTMNGGQQVAYNGDPLYRFSGDTKAGDTNGQGINGFGGTWHAGTTSATATAPAATATPQTSPPTTSGSSSSGGGYGYG